MNNEFRMLWEEVVAASFGSTITIFVWSDLGKSQTFCRYPDVLKVIITIRKGWEDDCQSSLFCIGPKEEEILVHHAEGGNL